MREFIDATGKTEETAVQEALRQLNLDRDDVSVEVLERAKSGFLGLGSCPAKVRVYYGPENEEPAPVKEEAPVAEAPKAERPARREMPAEKPVREEKPVRQEKIDREEEISVPVVDLGEEVDDEKAQAIKTFLSGLLTQMEIEAEAKVYQPEKPITTESFQVTDHTTFAESELEDGVYLMMFEMVDAKNNTAFSEMIQFVVDGEYIDVELLDE